MVNERGVAAIASWMMCGGMRTRTPSTRAPARGQQFTRLGVVNVDAGAVQAFQRGLIYPLDLAVGKNPELGGLQW